MAPGSAHGRHDQRAMAGAETFVHEMEDKNQASFQRLLAAYIQILEKENFSPADLVRLEMKNIIEAIEVAALWLAESDSLDVKLALAAAAAMAPATSRLLRERLTALGIEHAGASTRASAATPSCSPSSARCRPPKSGRPPALSPWGLQPATG